MILLPRLQLLQLPPELGEPVHALLEFGLVFEAEALLDLLMRLSDRLPSSPVWLLNS
jgi:hypothetical protein